MTISTIRLLAVLLLASPALAQQTNDPLPADIAATEDIVAVDFVEFATIPDIDGEPPRMMLLVDEPGTSRLFVSDMTGLLYSVSYDGQSVELYLDLRAATWGFPIEADGDERGFQSFAFHPEFNTSGAPGFGKFYTYSDTPDTVPEADFTPGGGDNTHDTVLLEWTASDPAATTYDGGPPRQLLRFEQPFRNHNAGHLGFNPLATPGSEDDGLLYVGVADGGSGADPLELGQNMSSAFAKILLIDPLGTNSTNGQYGIPASNPFVSDGDDGTLDEIYASGLRNPQRLWWDPANGNMYVAEIGQNIVEEISPVTAGANLGWNDWEGSFRFLSRQAVDVSDPRGDPQMTYPVVEYGQRDPLFRAACCAATGGFVYRDDAIPQLSNLLVFGDNPSGEVMYVEADDLPNGGEDAIRRILFNDGGEAKTLIQIIRDRNAAVGRPPARRVDLRFGTGPDDQIFILNKQDGIVRLLVPSATGSQ